VTLLQGIVRHRRWILVVWLLLVVAAGYGSRNLKDLLYGSIGTVHGSEAARVEEIVQRDFHSPYEQFLLVTVEPSTNLPITESDLQALVQGLESLPWVTGVLRPTKEHDRAALLVGLSAHTVRESESYVSPLRLFLKHWHEAHPAVTGLVTGEPALNLDLVGAASDEASRAESVVVPLTLLALVLTFGALGAASLPLVTGIGATVLAMGLLAVLAKFINLSAYAANIVTMLGLGLGIDYALFVIARVREERRAGASLEQAVVAAIRHAAPPIVASSVTVVIGLMALAAVPAEEPVGLGVGGAAVVATSVLACLTLLPALSAQLGRWLEAPKVLSRFLVRESQGRQWEAIARRILSRPWLALAVAVGLLVTLAVPIKDLHLGDPEMESMPQGIESIRAVKALRSMGEGGLLAPFQILVQATGRDPILTPEHLAGLARLSATLKADPRLDQVLSLASRPEDVQRLNLGLHLLGETRVRRMLPAEASTVLSADGRSATVYLIPQSSLTFEAVRQLARELRAKTWQAVPGLGDLRFSLGGPIAIANEFNDLTYRVFPRIVGVTLLTTLIAMFAFTRSWLIPLKAVVANTLTVAASLGGTFWLVHTPWPSRLMGLEHPMLAISPGIPLLAFCVVFGLSMDYEVFLISRIVEAHRSGASDREAIARGLGASGRVITSAAVVMSIVFLGFAATPFVPLKVLGTALALGVLLDATVVRLLLVPSMMVLVGKWNWWPGDGRPVGPVVDHPLERRLPRAMGGRVDVDGSVAGCDRDASQDRP
jgi:RND superfamily putative drug exporter